MEPSPMWNYLAPILLLTGSNVFMTFAWYGHLRYTNRPLLLVILVSWGIAFFEYCLQVPANRIGYTVYNPAQLKTIQEIITLLVFVVFSVGWLGATIKWNHVVGFVLIVIAAFFIFLD
ncbi:DMT family protein [Dokdonella immobilis]|uniref:DMT family protein n=1 Tax=Dokdonella immobilis TaxID=578942 RepID=UPI001587B210|nr:DMT family protein [Dokdonella immobilis]